MLLPDRNCDSLLKYRIQRSYRLQLRNRASVKMARLTFEEKGLLRILEGIQEGKDEIGPSVRYALLQSDLIEAGDPPRLTHKGERVLEEFRLRPVRATGEFPAFDLRLREAGTKV
jgi:hypothetical protein